MNTSNINKPILEARKITKEFSGVKALNQVDLKVYPRKVNAVVGENGAGKSTLMNILSGVYTEYAGELLFNGEKISFANTGDARQMGISIIHQELQLVPHMSIAENIFLGREPLKAGFIDYKIMEEKARALLVKLNFDSDVKRKISSLRVGQQQLVEIAKALSFDVRVLVMDEPTSALSEGEIKTLFNLIRSLKSRGVAIIYITHKMDELTELADTVTVLRDGCFISSSEVKNIAVDEIVKLMVGRDTQDFFVKKDHETGSVCFKVEDVSLKKAGKGGRYLLKDIGFSVKTSEVLGIYGLMGAGRTELFETIFGLHKFRGTGNVYINEIQVDVKHPKDAIHEGLALIPEDRKNDGLVLDMPITKNLSLASLESFTRNGLINETKEHNQADYYRKKLNIKSTLLKQPVVKLSGGNQQKVVIAKWLLTLPNILLLDEPTRGIDVNAKNEIYKLIDDLASQGKAIVIVSSELPEIMAISDRIITLCNGRLTGEFNRIDFTKESILKAALP
ncbi:MAG: sugar ABC transporter ATP-binding protein [candidate division KSB1 bacterium]|nr:sugar ABC transporter ATP-binding protein [candidate division KSB1 bacterium]